MIEQNVRVVRRQGARLWVRMGSQSGCTACDNGQGCGAGLFAKLLQHKPVDIELALNDLDVSEGQMVTLSFPEQVYLKLVFATYGWPLLAALVAAFAGHSLAHWLQLGPVLIDGLALGCGLLAGARVMHMVKKRDRTDSLLNSLHMTVCSQAETPDMCNNNQADLT